ncbi:protein DEFECTIVE IN MERISTEM SILENCING 3 isoform X2 [Brachypodium distachyon]|uniref:Protein DEFECTIVE IN MERISTEM SILENCING 3 n=1 Tax=Brachypodium distachyon TaxID=15368 RepID=A0A2K2D7H1_BRADI|nr:protein DEFECTIVE IN MERISTEM SILENCING 3 isoform X2 [Brachypodium distachyon]PNT70225.1 hypothetical protein BRADI_2g08040v3 [Brachypodium distachyon]|eukprot:XP_014754668.1 protein DEFECTIVE IN MERISTEM SILENCING 3 isoform X2 [Brachypodium distachyon]
MHPSFYGQLDHQHQVRSRRLAPWLVFLLAPAPPPLPSAPAPYLVFLHRSMETPLANQIIVFNTKEGLQKLGQKLNHHEGNIKLLKSEIDVIEQSIADLSIKLGKKAVNANNGTSVQEADQRVIQSICHQDKTAASIVCELRNRHSVQASKVPQLKDVLGVVATLGKVNDDNLSSILSEYLGIENMLGLVCKTYDGVKLLETYDKEGTIDKTCGIHGLSRSIGKFLDGRFTVFSLENMRPFPGDVMIDDPQRWLMLHKPRLPSGESPPGFLNFAVNMIQLDQAYLSYLTRNGQGLRETLFYSLFSHLQVYETTADLRHAIPFINDGAISLDGSILRPNGSFCLGDRRSVEVKFAVLSLGSYAPSSIISEMEEQIKLKNWEKERLVEDIKIQEDLWKQVKDLFEKQKKQLMEYLAQPSPRLQGSPTIRSPATPGSNPFAVTPRINPFAASPGSNSFAVKPPHMR